MSAFDYARQAGEMFVLPESCLKIKELLDDGVSDLDEIAALISLDPALASRLLKLANSALYHLPQRVDNLSKAVRLLGQHKVYNLVLATGTTQAFANLAADVVDLRKFWQQSVHCALITQCLAEHLDLKNQDALYLSGLLHNIGELVVVQLNPVVAKLCAAVEAPQLPWLRQQELLDFTYADATVALLKLWQLPDAIVAPLGYVHQPQLAGDCAEKILLHIATRLAYQSVATKPYDLAFIIKPIYAELLGLDHRMLEQAMHYATIEGLAILNLISPESSVIY
jgi:HD-like signal output (HDOD) protein